MTTLVIFNHPYDDSFCNAILKACTNGLAQANKEIDVIHLDKEKFNPVMTEEELKAFAIAHTQPQEAEKMLSPQVLEYAKRIKHAEQLVFIFPIWWMLMPALTKGFIDKVFLPGIAYRYNEKDEMEGLLHNIKQVTVITTMGAPGSYYETKINNAVWKALEEGTFKSIGIDNCKWINLSNIKNTTKEERIKWLNDIEQLFACKK